MRLKKFFDVLATPLWKAEGFAKPYNSVVMATDQHTNVLALRCGMKPLIEGPPNNVSIDWILATD